MYIYCISIRTLTYIHTKEIYSQNHHGPPNLSQLHPPLPPPGREGDLAHLPHPPRHPRPLLHPHPLRLLRGLQVSQERTSRARAETQGTIELSLKSLHFSTEN